MYYLNSRYYDPVVGRFINADGIVGANGGIQGYNMFAYCNNNPINYHDPDGEFASAAGALGTASILAGANSWHPGGWVMWVVIGVAAVGVGIWAGDTIYQNQKHKPKAPSLPSYKKLKLNKNHIMSGHGAGGNRGGPNKDRFPKWMTWPMIQKAIQEAYGTGKRIQTQGDSVFLRGFSKTYNTVVEMWVNLKDKIIETAWPK